MRAGLAGQGGADRAVEGDVHDDPPLLDAAHLEAQTFGDRDLEREVLALFVAQVQAAMSHRPDADSFQLFHKLKGAALGVGATALARQCIVMEQHPNNSSGWTSFRPLLARTLEAVRERVAQAASPG